MMPHEKHRGSGPKKVAVRIVTVSTSRFEAKKKGEELSDESGDLATGEIGRLGYSVDGRALVSDEPDMIRAEIEGFLRGKGDVLLLLGGTGVSKRDVTIETARPFFEKELDGFGEMLRSASLKKIGSAAVMTRATAGVAGGKLIVCLPGSPDASRTALKLFGKEFPHLLFISRT